MSFSDAVKAKRETLAAQIISLSRQLNELTHTARLPPELLSEIFANIHPYQPLERTSHGALLAAQVCHHWREVALQNSQLWTHIELNRGKDYLRMMFERSRQRLLDISGICARHQSTYPLLWQNIHRVRSIVFPTVFIEELELPSAKLHAPCLETFMELSTHTVHYDDPLLCHFHAPQLRRAKLLARNTPALHSLTMLTHLDIWWVERPRFADNISLQEVITTLGTLTSLSSLRITLSFLYTRNGPEVPQDCPVVTLDKLELLEFGHEENIAGAAFFLEHARFPLSTHIIAKINDATVLVRETQVQSLLLRSVATILGRWSARRALSELHLELKVVTTELVLAVSAPAEELPDEWWANSNARREHPLKLEMKYLPGIPPLLTDVVSQLRLLNINAHWRSEDIQVLRNLFAHLDHVENVSLVNKRTRRLRNSDRRFIEVGEFFTNSDGKPLFPNLSTLKLSGINFVGGSPCYYCRDRDETKFGSRRGSADDCDCAEHCARLVGWLAKRRELGIPLTRLVFEHCSKLTPQQKVELQPLVTGDILEIDRRSTRSRRARATYS